MRKKGGENFNVDVEDVDKDKHLKLVDGGIHNINQTVDDSF